MHTVKPEIIPVESFENGAHRGETFKAEFFTHLSHELRTPLNSILSLSQLMMARGPGTDREQDAEYLKIIERNGRHLLGLVNDILDLSRIEAEGMPVRCATFLPGCTIRHAVAMARPLAEAKRLKIGMRISTLPVMYSDECKIRQILLNLLSNAIKFTERGSIDVAAAASEEHLCITVADSGVGIASENLERVFGQFQQVDDTRAKTKEGSGLGLTISRRLAALLGGELAVKSEVGLGCCFTLKIPVRHQDVADASADGAI